jgi:hypothetical protein
VGCLALGVVVSSSLDPNEQEKHLVSREKQELKQKNTPKAQMMVAIIHARVIS